MNRYYLFLKGNNKELASAEFETVWEVFVKEKIKLKQAENVLYFFESEHLLTQESDFLKRLTFTNFIGIELYSGIDIHTFSTDFDFNKLSIYDGKKFCCRVRKSKKIINVETEVRMLAKPIWDSFKTPIVSMENYDVEFSFIFFGNGKNIHLCKKIYENDKEYLDRMPKLRPEVKPYTLKSDMARAGINLLKLKKGVVLDPFCGIGGILLEAYDLGYDVIGNDISWNDLKKMKTNFDYYFPRNNCKRVLADSSNQFLMNNTIDGIVTDIPYGKCSRKLGDDLYENYLKSSKCYLKKGARMIIIYANFVDFKEKALKYFEMVCEIEEYINKSMTRYILVLENNEK